MEILSIPPEIFPTICSFLETQDLLRFRLCCKDIRDWSLSYFGKRYLTQLFVLVTSNNFRILKEIAEDDYFRFFIRELYIVPSLFEGKQSMTNEQLQQHVNESSLQPQENAHTPPQKIQDLQQRYQILTADHLNTASSENLESSLACYIPRFPGLKSIGLSHHRGFDNGDPGHMGCMSFPGWHKLLNIFGFDPTIPWEASSPLPQGAVNVRMASFIALMKALLAPGAETIRLETLTTCQPHKRCFRCCSGLFLGELNYFNSNQRDLVLRRLDGMAIKKIHFCVRDFRQRPFPEAYEFIRRVIVQVAPKITIFEFDSPIIREPPSSGHFRWLSKHVLFENLERLDLSGVIATVSILTTFLSTASQTLRYVRLSEIVLVVNNAYLTSDEEIHEKSKELWFEVWNWFSRSTDLIAMEMSSLRGPAFPDINLKIQDKMHGPGGSNQLTSDEDCALFVRERCNIGFSAWISQLGFDSWRNDGGNQLAIAPN